MTTLRQKLGDLVNRAAYGGKRIILVSRGQPKAAIIGVEDLHRLEQLSAELASQTDRHTQALTNAAFLRERIQRWQAAHGIEAEDSVETLRRLREEHNYLFSPLF
jgi:prevent-host-death family protein